MKEVLLYASEAAVAGTGTGGVYKASDFLGAEANGVTTTQFFFKKSDGTAAACNLQLTHTLDGHVQVMEAMARLMNSPGGFKIVADEENSLFMQVPNRPSDNTGISITLADVTV